MTSVIPTVKATDRDPNLPAPANVHVFVYDLGMDPTWFNIFTGITPISTTPASVKKHVIFFSKIGFFGSAPCFPNLLPLGTDKDVAHGVLHEISRNDMQALSHFTLDNYRCEWRAIEATRYDGSVEWALHGVGTRRSVSVHKFDFKKMNSDGSVIEDTSSNPEADNQETSILAQSSFDRLKLKALPTPWFLKLWIKTSSKVGLNSDYIEKMSQLETQSAGKYENLIGDFSLSLLLLFGSFWAPSIAWNLLEIPWLLSRMPVFFLRIFYFGLLLCLLVFIWAMVAL